jgi:hypothetical protein
VYLVAAVFVGRFFFGVVSFAITDLRIVDLATIYLAALVIGFVNWSIELGVDFHEIKHEFGLWVVTIFASLVVMLLGACAFRVVEKGFGGSS